MLTLFGASDKSDSPRPPENIFRPDVATREFGLI
jgi:hypothetical protein